jgi:ParB/RepB/Spo0J family partition protein
MRKAEKKQKESTIEEYPTEYKALYISTKLIRPNRFNPRTDLDKESDEELLQSVSVRGVETNIHVRPIPEDGDGHVYEVYDGDRRLAAAIKAKIATVPVLIEKKNDHEMIEFSLVSTIRRDYNDIETGRAIIRLLSEYSEQYPTQAKLARKLTMTRAKINQLVMTVKNLDEQVQEYVAPADPATKRIPEGAIDGHLGYELSKIPDKERQRETAKEIISHPELTWLEKRVIASEAKEEPETPVEELTSRRRSRSARLG